MSLHDTNRTTLHGGGCHPHDNSDPASSHTRRDPKQELKFYQRFQDSTTTSWSYPKSYAGTGKGRPSSPPDYTQKKQWHEHAPPARIMAPSTHTEREFRAHKFCAAKPLISDRTKPSIRPTRFYHYTESYSSFLKPPSHSTPARPTYRQPKTADPNALAHNRRGWAAAPISTHDAHFTPMPQSTRELASFSRARPSTQRPFVGESLTATSFLGVQQGFRTEACRAGLPPLLKPPSIIN